MTPPDPLAARPAVVGLEALTPAASNGHAPHAAVPGLNGSATRPWKVAAVVPCFNRRHDLELLLRDVARQDLRGIDLWLTVVDNASTDPLATIAVPDGLRVEFVRLDKNSGGSGGFNAGMAHVLSGAGLSGQYGPADFLWWLDSDARAGRRCLRQMVKVLAKHRRVGAVGSALGDVLTGHTWEVGGNIVRRNGRIWPAGGGDLDRRFLVRADYLAACSALVRREVIERTGLFPDNFIYYDDVEWCLQMTAKTGLKVRGAPRSRAYHPPGNRRYVTWARYYIARNCFTHIDCLKLGGMVRARRSLVEISRAVGQAAMGLPELGELHLRGLEDAVHTRFPKYEPRELVGNLGFIPFTKLLETVERERAALRTQGSAGTLWVHPILRARMPGFDVFRTELRKLKYRWPKAEREHWERRAVEGHALHDFGGALWRALTGPTADIAIVTTGWPTNWFRGRTLIQVTSEGLLVRTVKPWSALRKAASLFFRGMSLAGQLWRRGPFTTTLPPAPTFRPQRPPAVSVPTPAPAAAPQHVG